MTDFPDSWTVSLFATPGQNLGWTFPACPGISHVITNIDVFVGGGASANQGSMYPDNNAAGAAPWPLSWAIAQSAMLGSVSWSGKMTAPAGKVVVITFGVMPTGDFGMLTISGYAI